MDRINKTWEFPEDIKFEEVPQFLKKFEKIPHDQVITFDLTKTMNIHSSFLGFLIHAKRKIEGNNGTFRLKASESIRKIFSMVNLSDYLV